MRDQKKEEEIKISWSIGSAQEYRRAVDAVMEKFALTQEELEKLLGVAGGYIKDLFEKEEGPDWFDPIVMNRLMTLHFFDQTEAVVRLRNQVSTLDTHLGVSYAALSKLTQIPSSSLEAFMKADEPLSPSESLSLATATAQLLLLLKD